MKTSDTQIEDVTGEEYVKRITVTRFYKWCCQNLESILSD